MYSLISSPNVRNNKLLAWFDPFTYDTSTAFWYMYIYIYTNTVLWSTIPMNVFSVVQWFTIFKIFKGRQNTALGVIVVVMHTIL